MNYIQATDMQFDAKALAAEYNVIYNSVKADQINLRKHSDMSDLRGLTYFSGSLYKDGKQQEYDANWDMYITSLNNCYTIDVLKEIEGWV